MAFQIFGHKPESVHDAAKIVAETGCQMIDMNFGCPAKKIVKNLSGAALMKDLKASEKLITAAVTAVDIPISVKFRSGWDRGKRAIYRIREDGSGVRGLLSGFASPYPRLRI